VIIRVTPKSGANIRRAGEDISAGSEVLPAGVKMRPQEMGLIASIGLAEVPVYRKLRVALFFTGDEIVMREKRWKKERSTTPTATPCSACSKAWAAVWRISYCAGQPGGHGGGTQAGWHEADLIVTSGGVSVGEEDHVKAAVESLAASICGKWQ